MHHLRLIMGASYWGAVKADKDHPDVYVPDGAAYESAMASGYFIEIQPAKHSSEEEPTEDGEQGEATADEDHTHATELSKMTVEELKAYAGINGISLGSARKKEDILRAVQEAEEKAAEARAALREE